MIWIDYDHLRANMKDDVVQMTDESVKPLRPVFTGKTKQDEEITLFQHIDRPEEIHILLPGEELVKLGRDAEINTYVDMDRNEVRVDVVSSVWTGQARGSKWDLMQVDAR